MNKRIIKSNDEAAGNASFNTVLYTGNSSTKNITGVGFQPDMVWMKLRNLGAEHILSDSVRGVNKELSPNNTYFEEPRGVVSFDSDGFSLNSNYNYNDSTGNYVAWCWKAGGAAVANTDGTITSQVSANVDAGFSIVSYTGNGSAGSVGHGLGTAPQIIIAKNRDGTNSWVVRSSALGNGYLQLESTVAYSSTTIWGTPNDTVFNFTANANGLISGNKYIAYCFAEVAGFSKFGSYEGTGNTSGEIVSTGFEVAFLLVKKATGSADDWFIFDNKRTPIGEAYIRPNSSSAELDYGGDFMRIDATDGFQPIWSSPAINALDETYIYMAFANQF